MSTILVADDVLENRYFLTSLLEGNGYRVVSAADGAEALRLAGSSPPALVITDLMMPVVDGFELCRRWKQDERLKRIPLVVYTATYTDPKDERLALSLGADRFLVKPLRPETLLLAIREVLESAEQDPGSIRGGAAGDDRDLLQQHNEALRRKLEKKVQDLEAEVSRRSAIESALREEERRYRLLAENLSDVVWSMGLDGRFSYVSPAVEKLLGFTPAELRDRHLEEVLGPDVYGVFEAELARISGELSAGRTPGGNQLVEIQQGRKDGARVWTEISSALMRDEHGNVIGLQGVTRDITERKRAEQRSKDEESARQALQGQLLQAQRLESIGRLAGGVAHDFNNLLSVVLGYTEFALQSLHEGDPLRADLAEIRRAGERAAALTRRLLAFSRKQVLEPAVLDVNDVITGIEAMLRRLLGENIEIAVRLSDSLGHVLADRGQMEQVVMNLAVNARDAMPGGGRLTIETAEVELDHTGILTARRGRFVMLAVSDTGAGMDAQTKEHLFEPFFTTKEKGKGTGLGLSMVYGIVKQSGGNIWVDSEPGRGATFKMYFPRVDAPTTEPVRRPVSALATGRETVLLVEDEDAVRRIAERILRSAGYEVLVASGGGDALLLSEKHGAAIDLLLTDVVMPQMSGKELADRIGRLSPKLKVLYMSGYTDDAIAQNQVLDPGTRFIGKPFAPAELARKVREVLDAGRTASS